MSWFGCLTYKELFGIQKFAMKTHKRIQQGKTGKFDICVQWKDLAVA